MRSLGQPDRAAGFDKPGWEASGYLRDPKELPILRAVY